MRSVSLYGMICLTGMAFGADIVSSHVTQSLVLLINAYHMLYNFLSLLLLVFSHRMSKGKTLKNTFGWVRVKVLGLLVNILFLAALCFAVSVEAVQTMVHASHEDTEPKFPRLIIALGVIDFVINVVCFLLIGGYTHHQGCSMVIQGDDVQLNCVLADSVPASNGRIGSKDSKINIADNSASNGSGWCWDHKFLDISRDVSSCLTVIACGCIILLMDGLILKYADAILAIASVIVLTSTTYPFVCESGLILLQSIPNYIDVQGLKKRLSIEFPDVLNVHDLHVWRLTVSEVIATVHVMLSSPHIYTRIEKPLTRFFLKEGISSVTVQPEFTNGNNSEKKALDCILQCSAINNCNALTCCGPLPTSKSSPRQRCVNTSHGNRLSLKGTALSDVPIENSDYDFSKFAVAIETTV